MNLPRMLPQMIFPRESVLAPRATKEPTSVSLEARVRELVALLLVSSLVGACAAGYVAWKGTNSEGILLGSGKENCGWGQGRTCLYLVAEEMMR